MLLASCGGGGNGPTGVDAGGGPDAGGGADAAGGPDASLTLNPPRLWLAGINGSESNLELIETGPPSPF